MRTDELTAKLLGDYTKYVGVTELDIWEQHSTWTMMLPLWQVLCIVHGARNCGRREGLKGIEPVYDRPPRFPPTQDEIN